MRGILFRCFLAALGGAMTFLATAQFDIWPLGWVSVLPLLWMALGVPGAEGDKVARRYAFLFGVVMNAGGFYWVLGFLQRFGHLPLWAAFPIFLLLVGYQAITWIITISLVRFLRRHLPLSVVLLAPVVYTAVELVIPYVFPFYLSINQSWVTPAIQIAELTGPLGVSFLLVLSSAVLYQALTRARARQSIFTRAVVIGALVVIGNFGYGFVRIAQVSRLRAAAPKLSVGVVQGNVGIQEKWDTDLAARHLQLHQSLSTQLEQRGAQLLVWPESSYPYLFPRAQTLDYPANHPWRVRRGFTVPLLFGSLTAPEYGFPYNSALMLDAESHLRGRFDKNILMVFGEYIPFYDQMKWAKKLVPDMSNWARGTDVTTFTVELPPAVAKSFGQSTAQVAPDICYEDLFPSFFRRIAKLTPSPNLLINITNDAWFGRTSEPWEHMALSVYRAVELRLDLIRSVNTGVSVLIDATGKLAAHTEAFDPDEAPAPPNTLLVEAALLHVQTLYAQLGEWFGSLCFVLVLLGSFWALARAGQPVRWRLVLLAAGALVLTIVVGISVSCGPSQLGTALALLAHRPVPDALPDVAFADGVWLFAWTALGCLVAGAVLAWRAVDRNRRLESYIGVLAVTVAPALLVGTLEGEQAGLVIGGILALCVARLGAVLMHTVRRLQRRGQSA